ncbi:protein of unknown function DUF1568 [Pirellula staleyi DSM 6068]|uniref:Transposase IS200-like domain-containing protein n=1 Tax=Pirellula staleyi (strain ATCC 27377 / DSM 6068 / ICPB 4128) TaxID=530564 RepID=D2R2X3_PIRSD|nr:transposase [Pirellula staleyi]ADB18706.1 protein of unknown function DUF1568 [Pirellula staleyi DSM 6068]
MSESKFIHFVTFGVDSHRRLLDLDQPKRLLLGTLNHQLEALNASCVGFVIMPDHVHALLWVPQVELIDRFLHGWKRMSSYAIRRWYAEHAPHYFSKFGMGKKFWRPRSFVLPVELSDVVRIKLDYIHLNPVRAGLVDRAIDWRWSSARYYIEGRSVGVPVRWVE